MRHAGCPWRWDEAFLGACGGDPAVLPHPVVGGRGWDGSRGGRVLGRGKVVGPVSGAHTCHVRHTSCPIPFWPISLLLATGGSADHLIGFWSNRGQNTTDLSNSLSFQVTLSHALSSHRLMKVWSPDFGRNSRGPCKWTE
jgi:hypothetical protein